MAEAPVGSCPRIPPPEERGVCDGQPPRHRWAAAACPPGALKRKLARAAPGGRDDGRPRHTPGHQTERRGYLHQLCARAYEAGVDRHRLLGRLTEVEALPEVDPEVGHRLEL